MVKGRWLAAAVVIGVAVTALVVGCAREQAAAPEVVRAQVFELVDAQGEVRAVLGLQDGSPALWLTDEDGRARAAQNLRADGSPRLTLTDDKEVLRAALSQSPDGSAGLMLYDENGRTRAVMSLLADGSPGVELMDDTGAVIWQAP